MENILQIPRITNTTIKYFVDGEFIDNVTIDEVNKIRENVLEYVAISLVIKTQIMVRWVKR